MINRKVLLLNSTYEVLSFITDKRAIKLIFKGKAETVSHWDGVNIYYGSGYMPFPSILKLKYYVSKRKVALSFSRNAMFKRDKYCCQYCGKVLSNKQATMDHIVPKSSGGKTSFENCITACYECNNRKGSRTLEEARMELLTKPVVPYGHFTIHFITDSDDWHNDWNVFFTQEKKFYGR